MGRIGRRVARDSNFDNALGRDISEGSGSTFVRTYQRRAKSRIWRAGLLVNWSSLSYLVPCRGRDAVPCMSGGIYAQFAFERRER
jgi:hypothetical protein